MKQKILPGKTISRRKKAFLLLILVAGIITTLLYFEQIALIYVLATLGLVILLTVVALADLEKVGLEEIEPAEPAQTPAGDEQKRAVKSGSG